MSVVYPLPCGCKSEHWYQLCATHQNEVLNARAQLMGLPDLRFTHRQLTDLEQLPATLRAIQLRLISNPTKSCVIKITPEPIP